MGTKPAEKKRKKKGRPSLLDLQKRSLRLQQQQQQQTQKKNPSPNTRPNPPPHRRITRRNPNPEPGDTGYQEEEEEEEEVTAGGKRREKKLKLVLKLPRNASESGSDADEEPARRKRRIGAVGDGDAGNKTSAAKGTDRLRGEPPDSGPTTPLPDKKLLVFILDRLQKKDTYGVFSEPVDPEELPDYHEVIEHPMDFGTVRKILNNGDYANLEQFEADVFLISSNAMTYNAPDTIYYRQARAIQELAKKSFENLRQDSDDNEPEPKIARRGRPPSKNIVKKMPGRPPDRASSDFSADATLANAGDNAHWSNSLQDLSKRASTLDKPNPADVFARVNHVPRKPESSSWVGENKSERDEENTVLKGVPTKYGKKSIIVDENRRNTYKQSQWPAGSHDFPVFTSLYGERKQLVPIGLQMEHAYARSLARFTAKLGPIAWTIAARRIERVLPSGMKFGHGWIGDAEAPQQSLLPQPVTSSSQSSLQSKLLPSSTIPGGSEKLSEKEEHSSNYSIVKEGDSKSNLPPVTSVATTNPSSHVVSGNEARNDPNNESRNNPQSSGSDSGTDGGGLQPKPPPVFQFQRNPTIRPVMNGLTGSFGFNPQQAGKMFRPVGLPESISSEGPMTRTRAFDMVSRGNNIFIHQTPNSHPDTERVALTGNQATASSSAPLPSDSSHSSQGSWKALSLNSKPDSVPPDLNVGFQSPTSGAIPDSQQHRRRRQQQQQPDLALQL